MARTVEFLIPPNLSKSGTVMLERLLRASQKAGDAATRSVSYNGGSDWLVLFGVGHHDRAPVRTAHVAKGGKVIMWDLGYFSRQKQGGYLRFSIDVDHAPPHLLDTTPDDPSRWLVHNLVLREDYKQEGHIILVGLGFKSRQYLALPDWEKDKLQELRKRFPGRKVVYRPKPRRPYPHLSRELCVVNDTDRIEDILRGASLVVCRHSNVAVDACVAGVPFECEDGAAVWLRDKPYTPQIRQTFLSKLCWWQWKAEEAHSAWKFVKTQLGEPV